MSTSTASRDVRLVSLARTAVAATTGYVVVDRSQVYASALNPQPHLANSAIILRRLRLKAELTTLLAASWTLRVGLVADITASSANLLWLAQWELSNLDALLISDTTYGLDGESLGGIDLTIREVALSVSDLAEAGTSATAGVATNGFTNAVVGDFVKYSTGAAAGLRRRITTRTDASNVVYDTFGATAPADGDAFQVVYDTGANFSTSNRSLNHATFTTGASLVVPGGGPAVAPALNDLVALATENSGTETLDFVLTAEYATR